MGAKAVKKRVHFILTLVVLILCVGLFLWREHQATGTFGFPLDDAWIHAQFARNLALGQGFSYNPGEPVSGSTAPLWTLVNATGFLIAGDPVLTPKILGILFLWLSVFFVYALVRAMTGDERQALFAAVATAALPRLVWASVSGMEITLAVTLSLAGIVAHLLYTAPRDPRQYLSTVLFGLAALARPECGVFFVAAMADRVLAAVFVRWREVAARDWLAPVAIHLLVFGCILLPFMVFSRRFGIGVLPNTAYAKALLWNTGLIAGVATDNAGEIVRSFTVRPYDYALSFLRESLDANPVLFVLGAFGLAQLLFSIPYREGSRCRSFIVPLSIVLFPLVVGVVVPFGGASYQMGRYAAPMAPLMLVIGTIGMYAAAHHAAGLLSEAKYLGRPATIVLERALLWVLMAFALIAQARGVWYQARCFGMQVDNIQDMQVSMAKWIDQNVPEDAVVAANDVGAIAYFSQRRVVDTVGLISPGVLGHMRPGVSRDDAVMAFLEEERPDYAVLFPNWYPDLVSRARLFERAHSVVLEENLICGGPELVAYRLRWEGWPDRNEKVAPPAGASRRPEGAP